MGVMDVDTEGQLVRRQCVYSSMDYRFEIQKEVYRGQQYSHIYFARLHFMRTLLSSMVSNWKSHLPVRTVLGLERDKECIIVGTLYKHMKLKPCILDEYSRERSVIPLVKPQNFVHGDDNLILEDESGRVKLRGDVIWPSVYVTGVVAALLGRETCSGDFLVQEVLEAGLPHQIEKPLRGGEEDKHVVFVSGLSVGSSSSNPLHFQLLVDHITGHLGERSLAARIAHVVVAGDSVELPSRLLNGQNLTAKDRSGLAEPIKELDLLLSQIVMGVSLDVMPGVGDPANFSLPQQALHRCLLPLCSSYSTFRSCTNPHAFQLDGTRFLGTSGQNIDDLRSYSDAEGTLQFMERTLRWRHLAPTAPNTLGCYPFTDRDPFLVEDCPHVYFAGNQDHFETSMLKGSGGQQVRLIAIPRFSESSTAVILNLKNLECRTLTLDTQLQ